MKVGLGAYYGFFDISPVRLNKLFVNMRPAILTYVEGCETDTERDALRAEIVSSVLCGSSCR